RTFSLVKPYFSTTKSPGALAPNPSIPITLPSVPTYLCQPNDDAISIATRFVIEEGKIDALYSSDCWSNAFQLGIDTTRTPLPCPSKSLAASMAKLTSEPVANSKYSGSLSDSNTT